MFSKLDREIEPLPLKGKVTLSGIGVHSVPAYNEAGGSHVDEDDILFHSEDKVIGLLLQIEGTTVFYPSDTDVLDHHEDISANVFAESLKSDGISVELL